MNEQDIDELQDPETWDMTDPEGVAPARKGRAVVSVSFAREDFERVAQFAEQQGTTLSEVVRSGALQLVNRPQAHAQVGQVSAGSQYGMNIFMSPEATVSQSSGRIVTNVENDVPRSQAR